MCIVKQAIELSTRGYIRRVCCGALVFAPRVLRPLLLFVMELSIGDRVFYTKSTGFGYPRRWLAFCTMGMWSWSMIKVVCGLSIIDAPWTPSPLAS